VYPAGSGAGGTARLGIRDGGKDAACSGVLGALGVLASAEGFGAGCVRAVWCFFPHPAIANSHNAAAALAHARIDMRFIPELPGTTASLASSHKISAHNRRRQSPGAPDSTIPLSRMTRGWLETVKQNPVLRFWRVKSGGNDPSEVRVLIFFLTSIANNLIYESHCDLYGSQIYVRENRSMKNATKKGGAKKTAKKTATKKKGK
jgi:hypothetical protein